jgi:hypothetical protein
MDIDAIIGTRRHLKAVLKDQHGNIDHETKGSV